MNQIYHYVGIISFWVIVLALAILLASKVEMWVLGLYRKHREYIRFYILRQELSSDHLRNKYRNKVSMSMYGKWVLLYRLRNINKAKSK